MLQAGAEAGGAAGANDRVGGICLGPEGEERRAELRRWLGGGVAAALGIHSMHSLKQSWPELVATIARMEDEHARMRERHYEALWEQIERIHREAKEKLNRPGV